MDYTQKRDVFLSYETMALGGNLTDVLNVLRMHLNPEVVDDAESAVHEANRPHDALKVVLELIDRARTEYYSATEEN